MAITMNCRSETGSIQLSLWAWYIAIACASSVDAILKPAACRVVETTAEGIVREILRGGEYYISARGVWARMEA